MHRELGTISRRVRIYHVHHVCGSTVGDVAILDGIEQRRAERFASPSRREAFLRRRIALRRLLADEIGCRPAEVQFSSKAAGKPFVTAPRTRLHFSTTTSAALTLIAISDAPVGLDCEFIRAEIATTAMAELILTASELRRWSSLPRDYRALDFFVAWTRKEAMVKASGVGLGGCPPDSIGVMSNPTAGLKSFLPQDGYIAALSIEAGCR